jgi:hypothetical protein
MKKRIYLKILHEFEEGLSDALRIYVNRPEGNEFYDISIEFVQVSVSMLLNFQAERGIIRVGKENWIQKAVLKETYYELNKAVEFEGNINWIYKKKNLPIEHNQMIKIRFDLTNIDKKRLPYEIEYIQESLTASCV